MVRVWIRLSYLDELGLAVSADEGRGGTELARGDEKVAELGGVSWISQLFGRLTDDGMTDGALVK